MARHPVCRMSTGSATTCPSQVLAAFDIPFPVAAFEINLEPFVFDQGYRPLQTHMPDLHVA